LAYYFHEYIVAILLMGLDVAAAAALAP